MRKTNKNIKTNTTLYRAWESKKNHKKGTQNRKGEKQEKQLRAEADLVTENVGANPNCLHPEEPAVLCAPLWNCPAVCVH
jgi:hypothetical protein